MHIPTFATVSGSLLLGLSGVAVILSSCGSGSPASTVGTLDPGSGASISVFYDGNPEVVGRDAQIGFAVSQGAPDADSITSFVQTVLRGSIQSQDQVTGLGDPTTIDVDGDGMAGTTPDAAVLFSISQGNNLLVSIEEFCIRSLHIPCPIAPGAVAGLPIFVPPSEGPFEPVFGDDVLNGAVFLDSDPASEPTLFVNGVNTGVPNPTLVDIDGDGDQDLFVGLDGIPAQDGISASEQGVILYFENIGGETFPPTFANGRTNFFGLDTERISEILDNPSPEFADLDGDGDFDLFVGNSEGDTLYFENQEDPANAEFPDEGIANPFGLERIETSGIIPTARISFVDIDRDGLLDAFIGSGTGDIIFFRNTGTRTNPNFDPPEDNPFGLGLPPGQFEASPAFVDLDGDGDYDVVIGDSDGLLVYQENVGTATDPDFGAVMGNGSDLFGIVDTGEVLVGGRTNATPEFVDIDGDADWDAFIGSRTPNRIELWENVAFP